MEVVLPFVSQPARCGLKFVMLKQRSLHQVRGKYVYGWNVWESAKQRWRNSTILSKRVSSCIFTRFSQCLTRWMEKHQKSNPEYWRVWVQLPLHFPALTVFSFVTYFLSFGNELFSFSPLFLPVLSLNANDNLSRIFCRVGRFLCSSWRRGRHVPACFVRQNACLVQLCF